MTKKIEHMSLAFAIHDSNLDEGSFRGMASVFNTMIDTWVPTRILPGAFTKTLQENKARIKVLYQHNPDWAIGVPTRMDENSDGLLVDAKISKTTMGNDVMILLRDKVITELSIGFDPIKYEMVDEGLTIGQVRHIKEMRLWEFSPVTFAANSDAKISSVNSLLMSLRGGGSAGFDLLPETHVFMSAVFEQFRKTPNAEPIEFWNLVTQSIREQHEGKVLSAKNKTLVTQARDALSSLLDAAEPADDDQSLGTLTAVNEKLRSLDLLHLEHNSRRF